MSGHTFRTSQEGMTHVFPFPEFITPDQANKIADYMMEHPDSHGSNSEVWSVDRARTHFSKGGELEFGDWGDENKEVWDAMLSAGQSHQFKLVQPPDDSEHWEAIGRIMTENSPLDGLIDTLTKIMKEIEND